MPSGVIGGTDCASMVGWHLLEGDAPTVSPELLEGDPRPLDRHDLICGAVDEE